LTTLGASQVLYSGGRLQGAARQAGQLAQAARFGQLRARQQVVFQTTTAYYTLLAAQHEQEVARQSLSAAQDHLKDAQARLDARAAPKYDVLRAEVGVEEARQEAVRAESAIAMAHAALLRALGVTEGRFTAAEVDAPVVTELPVLDQLLATAQAVRPELQAAERQVAAADAAVRVARGERLPTVSLTGSYQLVSPETPLQMTGWTVAAMAGLPMLDGGAARAKQREAQAALEQQQAASETLKNNVAAEVRVAHARLTSAREQHAVARKRLELAEEMWRIAGVRYREGVGTPTEVADAKAALSRALQGMIRVQTEWQVATAELGFAVGGE
jgi:outer membrane protein TolC